MGPDFSVLKLINYKEDERKWTGFIWLMIWFSEALS
jgi:hypothetical protein